MRIKGPFSKELQILKGKETRGREKRRGNLGKRRWAVSTRPAGSQHYSIGCISSNSDEYVELAVKESKTGKIRFLLDTGADISLVKSSMLARGTEFDPNQKVKIKSVNGSIVKTHGTLVLHIFGEGVVSPFKVHLVNKQVDLVYDGILGSDFLRHTQATICYEEGVVTFKQGNKKWNKRLSRNNLASEEGEEFKDRLIRGVNQTVQGTVRCRKLILPKRSEVIVRLPVQNGRDGQEGLIEKSMLSEGIYLANSVSKVTGDQVITSILNIKDEDVTIDRPTIELKELDGEEFRREDPEEYIGAAAVIKDNKVRRRTREVLGKLRLDHLNSEEKEAIEKVCKDYQDILRISFTGRRAELYECGKAFNKCGPGYESHKHQTL
jgi:hypothetical protein